MKPLLYLLVLLAVLLNACESRHEARIVGHAGMGTQGPLAPNGREAVLTALDLGIHGVELDVQLTADGVLVAYHDEALEEGTICAGLVNSLPWADIRKCATILPGLSDVTIIRLDSLLLEAIARHPEAEFTLDCKLWAHGDWWSYLEVFTDALVNLESRPELAGRLLVECQVDPFLQLLQAKRQTLPLFRYDHDPEVAVTQALAYHYAGITVHHGRISHRQVESARAHGLEVTLYGAGGAWSHWLALRKRPDRLQTDAPALLAPK